MTPSLSRRQALGLLGAAAGIGAIWWVIDDDPPAPNADGGAAVTPASLDDGLEAVGTAFLAGHPEEDDIDHLRDALDVDASTPASSLLTERAGQIAADHETGDVVDVDGWVLALTEARIAALHVRS